MTSFEFTSYLQKVEFWVIRGRKNSHLFVAEKNSGKSQKCWQTSEKVQAAIVQLKILSWHIFEVWKHVFFNFKIMFRGNLYKNVARNRFSGRREMLEKKRRQQNQSLCPATAEFSMMRFMGCCVSQRREMKLVKYPRECGSSRCQTSWRGCQHHSHSPQHCPTLLSITRTTHITPRNSYNSPILPDTTCIVTRPNSRTIMA